MSRDASSFESVPGAPSTRPGPRTHASHPRPQTRQPGQRNGCAHSRRAIFCHGGWRPKASTTQPLRSFKTTSPTPGRPQAKTALPLFEKANYGLVLAPRGCPALRRGVQSVPGAEHASHGRAPPLPHHYNALRCKGQPSMPTVRPRWSIEGTQWPAPQNTVREPRELLSNEEREAMRKTIEDADRAAESALSTTQRLHQRLQGLEDQGFVPAAPEYRSSERNQAEVAILSRGDRLSAAQLKNETQKVLDVWSSDDAEHWRTARLRKVGHRDYDGRRPAKGRSSPRRGDWRNRTRRAWSVQKNRGASRGSRDSRSGLTTRQTGTTSVTSGPRIASAAGIRRRTTARVELRPAFYRRTLGGDLTLTEEGDEASTAPPSPIKPEVSTITEGRRRRRAPPCHHFNRKRVTTSKWKSRFRMAAKRPLP